MKAEERETLCFLNGWLLLFKAQMYFLWLFFTLWYTSHASHGQVMGLGVINPCFVLCLWYISVLLTHTKAVTCYNQRLNGCQWTIKCILADHACNWNWFEAIPTACSEGIRVSCRCLDRNRTSTCVLVWAIQSCFVVLLCLCCKNPSSQDY